MNIIVLNLKKLFFPALFLSFVFCLLIFSSSNLPAVKNGLSLWANSVIPSLFPFFVATELLMHTNITYYFGILFRNFMKPIFNVSGECSFAFIMGIISGYPVGAKIACEFRNKKICSKAECERLLSFTNNSGPLFIIGAVGVSMFGNSTIGLLLFITHLLSSITVGFLFRFWKYNETTSVSSNKTYSTSNSSIGFSNLGEVLANSIASATSTIVMIGGFVVLFACIISILKSSGILGVLANLVTPFFNVLHINTDFIIPLFTGFFEITNGISLVSNIAIKELSTNIIITSFLLGFGGISILLQVWSIVAKTDLSIKPYIYGKFLHGIISAIYTFLFINIFPFFNFNL